MGCLETAEAATTYILFTKMFANTTYRLNVLLKIKKCEWITFAFLHSVDSGIVTDWVVKRTSILKCNWASIILYYVMNMGKNEV